MDRQEQTLYFLQEEKEIQQSTFQDHHYYHSYYFPRLHIIIIIIILIIFHVFSITLFSSVGWQTLRPCHDWRDFQPRFLFLSSFTSSHSRTKVGTKSELSY